MDEPNPEETTAFRELTDGRLLAAVVKAVEVGLLPRFATPADYLANWEKVRAVVLAGMVEMPSDLALAAKMLARKAGRVGGKARAESLSPERRSEIARKAAQARWDKTRHRDDGKAQS